MIGSFQGFDPYSYFRVPEMFFHFPFSNGFLTCRPWVWVRKQQEKEDWCHPNQTSNPKTTGIYFQPQNGGWKFGVSGLNISNPKLAHMAKFGRVVVRFGEQSFPNLAEVSHLVMDKSVWIIEQPRFFFCFLRTSYADMMLQRFGCQRHLLQISRKLSLWRAILGCQFVFLWKIYSDNCDVPNLPEKRRLWKSSGVLGIVFLTCLQPFESTKGRCEQDKKNGMILKDSNSLSQIESARTKTQTITTGIPDFITAYSTSWRKDVRLLFFAGNHLNNKCLCFKKHKVSSQALQTTPLKKRVRGWTCVVFVDLETRCGTLSIERFVFFCCSGLGNPLAVGHIGFIV